VSANPLRAPNFIIDITRPQNGCGGCTKYPMNSKVPNQATWRTADGSAWWLRSTRYSQPNGPKEWPHGRANPNGDYVANCYMDLWRLPSNENTVQFNDRKCSYRSRSYYCQPLKAKPKPRPPPPPPPAKRLVPTTLLGMGLKEEVWYFNKKWNGKRIPNLNRAGPPSITRAVYRPKYYFINKKNWPGLTQSDNFAVRWTGYFIAPKYSAYRFRLSSDDGSNLYMNNRRVINNDGLHGKRDRYGTVKLKRGQHALRMEYFEKGGGAGIYLWCKNRYMSGRGRSYEIVTEKNLRFKKQRGFLQEVYYIGGLSKIPNLNKPRPATQSIAMQVRYANTKGKWRGLKRTDNFAVRWTGDLRIVNKGIFRFHLSSDDGSRFFFGKQLRLNNDGLHGWRKVESTIQVRRSGTRRIIVEYFEKVGHAGCYFKYMGPDTRDKMVFVNQEAGVKIPLRPLSEIAKKKFPMIKTPALPKPKKLKKKAPVKKVR
jgi:putative component of toxin-antitoxin plasmid stabilization module